MALNNVALAGRLVADPISKAVGTDNIAACQFTLAVDKKGKDSGTNFIDCIAWRGAASTIAEYVKKGQMLGVIGRLDQSSWEKDGKKYSKIQVVVDDFTFLSPKAENNVPQAQKKTFDGPDEFDASMIPF